TPHHHTTTTHHHTPARPPTPITPEEYTVLMLCDGVRPVPAIQRAAGPEIDVPAVLARLVERRWVRQRLIVPADAHPERALRAWLESVEDPEGRRFGLEALESLERRREAIADAGRDPDALSAAMEALEERFTALTRTEARRAKGARTAPCRSLLYSDSRRSATVELGPGMAAALAPLRPLLASAAWLTGTLAARVEERLRPVYEKLAAEGPVPLGAFWLACMATVHGPAAEDARALGTEFQRRWAALLRPEENERRVVRSLPEVESAATAAFPQPPGGPGWPNARYASPDVLVVAESEEAVNRGEFELVLGELHLATNSLGASLFVNQHPDPDELLAETDRDFPAPRLMPLLPKEHAARLSVRTRYALVRPRDYLVALVEHTGDPARPRTVLSGDVLVQDREGRLTAVLPDGATFPVLDVFSHVLTMLVMDSFRPLPEAPHSPRITVDRMIIARETWRL
ncbi:lantibiotic dehydratase, partial [Streptomyces sedi]